MIMVVAVGFVSGIISGLGIGGGTILIPALIFLVGLDQHQAQGVNLIYFVPTALMALRTHTKNKNVEWKVSKSLVVYGVAGAVAGAFLATSMDPTILRKAFGGFLLLMGLSELFKKNKDKDKVKEKVKK